MKEVKTPRKPLAIYYAIVLLTLLLLNLVLLPWMEERQIKEVDYGTFMTMTEEKNIGRVDIESNQIIFTDKDETQVYKTGLMNDTGLTERLYDAGATFSSEIVEQSSPVLSFLIWFVLPIILFSAIGNQMNKKLMEKAGGGPGSMMFGGMGKSNAKVYVQSTAGIRFADVAGEDEAKENLQEVVNYLHDPSKYESIGAKMPKGILLVGPPGTGKTMLAKAVAGESHVPFFSMSGSEFVEKIVSMGASNVREDSNALRSALPNGGYRPSDRLRSYGPCCPPSREARRPWKPPGRRPKRSAVRASRAPPCGNTPHRHNGRCRTRRHPPVSRSGRRYRRSRNPTAGRADGRSRFFRTPYIRPEKRSYPNS